MKRMIKFKLLALFLVFVLAAAPTSGLAALADTASPTSTESSADAPDSEALELFKYVEAFPRGIVLKPLSTASPTGASPSSAEPLGLFSEADGGDSLRFILELVDGKYVLSFQKESSAGVSEGDPVPVYLTPITEEDSTPTSFEFVYVDEDGGIKNRTGTSERSHLLASVTSLAADVDAEDIPETVWIPEGLLVKHAEYEESRKAQPTASPTSPPGTPSSGRTSARDELIASAKEHIDKLLELDGFVDEFGEDRSLRSPSGGTMAHIVVDIVYVNGEWHLSTDGEDDDSPIRLYPDDYEMLDTSDNFMTAVGFVALIAASMISLAINVILILKKAGK